jgi:hypothetical protein
MSELEFAWSIQTFVIIATTGGVHLGLLLWGLTILVVHLAPEKEITAKTAGERVVLVYCALLFLIGILSIKNVGMEHPDIVVQLLSHMVVWLLAGSIAYCTFHISTLVFSVMALTHHLRRRG